jgi:hypothetical protein
MFRILTTLTALTLIAACSSSEPPADAGPDNGNFPQPVLGASVNVPTSCQSCLSQSSSQCLTALQLCGLDADCVALNNCINACTTLNAACINTCGTGQSVALAEWEDWYSCACTDCVSDECPTFCTLIGGDAGSDASTMCVALGGACQIDSDCCHSAQFCNAKACAECITSNNPCVSNSECCSQTCNPETMVCL